MSATFTGAPCRPMDKGHVPKAVLLRCPVCLSQPEPPARTVLEYDDSTKPGTPGRFWTDLPVRYVAIGVEQDAACQALLDHLDRAHDGRDFVNESFGLNFEQAGINAAVEAHLLKKLVRA
jgi:hypothetical protein